MSRYIDADKIIYSWQIDLDGQEHDGVTLQSIINKMPSIDAVPVRRGRWIGYNAEIGWARSDGSPVFLRCSVCNSSVLNNGSARWSYCPTCGARMDGEENG